MKIKVLKSIVFLSVISVNQAVCQTSIKPVLSIAYSDPFEVEIHGIPPWMTFFKPTIEFGGGVEFSRNWHRIEYGIGGKLTFASYKYNKDSYIFHKDKYNTLRFSTRVFISLQPIKKIDFRLGLSPMFYYTFSHEWIKGPQYELNNPFKALMLFVNYKKNRITTELGFIKCFDPYIKENEKLPYINAFDFYFRNIELTIKYDIFKRIKK